MQVINTLFHGIDLAFKGLNSVCRGITIIDNTNQLVNDAATMAMNEDRRQKSDYMKVATRGAILILDVASIKNGHFDPKNIDDKIALLNDQLKKSGTDETNEKLKATILRLEKSKDRLQKQSAVCQGVALGASIIVEDKNKLNRTTLYRASGLVRKIGDIKNNKNLQKAADALTLATVSGDFDQLTTDFNNWYALKSAGAPKVDITNLVYNKIPEAHHENEVFKQFICPITYEPIRFPVTAPNTSGGPDHHFERSAIVKWLIEGRKTNPVNNLPLDIKVLKENFDMRKIIEDEMNRLNIPLK
ncbi:MAG: hypothetical protein H0W88_00725 [Parachlamydiaceae bacterium]|nr:hypothetical protein [Parachlamydiaceae bacterium]